MSVSPYGVQKTGSDTLGLSHVTIGFGSSDANPRDTYTVSRAQKGACHVTSLSSS